MRSPSVTAPRAIALICLVAFAAVLTPGVATAQKSSRHTTRHATSEPIAVRGLVTGADIVRTARQYLGVRYLWGGTTPRAFDCSGYTRWVFGRYGIDLPRTAHEQAALGNAPFPGDLKAGDLLFFSGGEGAQHIAIYVGGDTIIHASSSGHRVKLDLIQPHGGKWARHNWFRNRLIAVRRILPAEGTFYIPGSPTTEPAVPLARANDEGSSFRRAPTVY